MFALGSGGRPGPEEGRERGMFPGFGEVPPELEPGPVYGGGIGGGA